METKRSSLVSSRVGSEYESDNETGITDRP